MADRLGNHKKCLVSLPTDLITAPTGDIIKHIHAVHKFLNIYKKGVPVHLMFDKKQIDIVPIFSRYFKLLGEESVGATGLARKCGCVLIYDLDEGDDYIRIMKRGCESHEKPYIIVTKEDLYKPIVYNSKMRKRAIRTAVTEHKLPTEGDAIIDAHIQ